MRFHPRKTVFLSFCVFIFISLGVYIYSKNMMISKKRQSSSVKLVLLEKKSRDVYWTKKSGVWRFQQSNHSSEKNAFYGNDVNNEEDDVDEQKQLSTINFNLNIVASDLTPLNRDIPDSRPKGCDNLTYPQKLPTISIVIPFHNEWPSVLMRTVHSLVNRTPKHLLAKIILVDDASELQSLKSRLSNYVKWTFPEGLVKIIRLPSRQGLIKARLAGFKEVTSETVSFFDSHMEVNKDWLQPLLYEIVKNRKTVPMAQLDYIGSENLDYKFYEHYRTRYGFKWDMEFYETFFRTDQLDGKTEIDPLPGVLMVGPGFVVDSQYFRDIGMYDDGMQIWGGENIEFAWRTWMCGGRMVHVPCSHIGHIERTQPYSFPKGRLETEMHNYKRAVDVWMGPYKEYVYQAIDGIEDVDAGNLTERLRIKSKLKCQDFSWFLKHIWPELLPYRDVGKHWGHIKSYSSKECLDNDGYLFSTPKAVLMKPCATDILKQGFALTDDGLLRTSLHCVVAYPEAGGYLVYIENCFPVSDRSHWIYEDRRLFHQHHQQCLQVMAEGELALQPCRPKLASQMWKFGHNFDTPIWRLTSG